MFDYLYNMRHKRKLNELVDIVNMTPHACVRHVWSWLQLHKLDCSYGLASNQSKRGYRGGLGKRS